MATRWAAALLGVVAVLIGLAAVRVVGNAQEHLRVLRREQRANSRKFAGQSGLGAIYRLENSALTREKVLLNEVIINSQRSRMSSLPFPKPLTSASKDADCVCEGAPALMSVEVLVTAGIGRQLF